METIQQITLSNCGPIQHVAIPCPGPGQIVVLRGRNGAGKTTVLEAAEFAVTGRGKPTIRDGATAGQIEAFGITVKLSGKNTRKGELAVESIEGKFNVSSLIDPGVQDGKAADAKRIKSFAMIQKVLPSAELFYDLVGGRAELEKVARPDSLESDDMVQMAERIKKDLHDAANREDDRATHAEGHAAGARQSAAGVDLAGESDPVKLQAALKSAIAEEARIKAEQAAAVRATRAAQLAKDQLADAEAEYSGPSVFDANVAEGAAKNSLALCDRNVTDLEDQLRDARQKSDLARQHLASCIGARKTAEQHDQAMAQWRQQVSSVLPVEPSAEELAAATQRVAEYNSACDHGAIIRRAKEQQGVAQQHIEVASAHRKKAGMLRDAAKGTDGVLSEIVAKSGSQLRVEHGRLVLDTPRRGKTLFHELSAGERARIAVDIGIDAMPPTGKQGVIIICQEIWESLDPQNRDALKAHIAERGVGILTAEASWEMAVNPLVYGTPEYNAGPPSNFDPEAQWREPSAEGVEAS